MGVLIKMRNEQIQVLQESKEVRRNAVSGRKDGGAHLSLWACPFLGALWRLFCAVRAAR